DEFTKVDHDYTVKLAKICREQGVEHFTLCSSSMANENSRIFYLKIKGKVENEIKSMQFPRYSIFRPGMLTCKRQESRPLESIANSMLKIISPVLPWSLSVPTKSVAKAMVINACRKPSEVPIVEHISHKLIINLAKEY
ncbi:Oxidoreductase htatip2, partial [Spiromyces aspiralis]